MPLIIHGMIETFLALGNAGGLAVAICARRRVPSIDCFNSSTCAVGHHVSMLFFQTKPLDLIVPPAINNFSVSRSTGPLRSSLCE